MTKSEEARWQLEQWNENCAVARSEARLSRLFRMPSEPTRSHHRGMTRWRCTGQAIFVAKPGQPFSSCQVSVKREFDVISQRARLVMGAAEEELEEEEEGGGGGRRGQI